jgi:hypothetical protein
MHTSRARVVSVPLAVGGWKGELSIEDDLVRIAAAGGGKELSVDLGQVKRASFNSMNGLWVFRLNDGRRVRFQSAGGLMSADRSPAGRETNDLIRGRLGQHGVRLLET